MAKPSKRSKNASATDAIALLTNDHQEVKELFAQYEGLIQSEAGDEEKQNLAEEICTMLTSTRRSRKSSSTPPRGMPWTTSRF